METGLTSEEARKRLEKFGLNELRHPREFTVLKLFVDQFRSPLIYILVFAGLVTLFLRDFTDSIVIFAAVVLNTIFGFYQEQKAQKSLQVLKSLLAPKTKVVRDGEQKIIDAQELVPGDLVVLTIGDRVSADGVLVEATDLTVNEAILTGESMPVSKQVADFGKLGKLSNSETQRFRNSELSDNLIIRLTEFSEYSDKNMAFMGTTVVTGIAKMVVTKTGMETEMGKMGKMVEEVKEEKTPLQAQIGSLAKILAIVVGMMTVLIFVIGELRGHAPLEMFTTSVAVAVAAIPEGLVVTLTVILALGMQRILKRKAIVRRLLAAETLGSVSVICADKTGTLTEGKLRVVKADTPDEDLLVKAAVLCNDMRDPLEVAMLDWVEEKLPARNASRSEAGGRNGEIEKLKEEHPRLDEIPFSPKYKYIATLHEVPREEKVPQVPREEEKARDARGTRDSCGTLLFLSGAPEIVLSKCKIENARPPASSLAGEVGRVKFKIWEKKFENYGKEGYRLVGFAYKTVNSEQSTVNSQDIQDLTWLGILVYEDPVREGVREVLEECQEAGIKVKVITGDYLPTALAVLEKLGLDGRERSLTGEELEKISAEELKKKVNDIVLFARTDPQQKLKIVKALKENNEVVAMMGDGVNDAPALKQADIGIVVNEASDVAKETADIVLLDSNFATIVHVMEEGRNIFENIKKVTLYLLSCSFTEIILIGGCLLLKLPLPITAAQILWINLVQDSLPAMALAFEPKEEELMRDMPRKKEEVIIDLPMKILIFIIGIITDFFLLGLVIATWRGILPFRFNQTMVFVSLGIISSFIIFACRSLRKPIFKYNPFANKFLTVSILLGFVFLGLAIYFPPFQVLLRTNPLGVSEWIFLVGLGLFNLLAVEGTKWIFIYGKMKNK